METARATLRCHLKDDEGSGTQSFKRLRRRLADKGLTHETPAPVRSSTLNGNFSCQFLSSC